MSEMVYDGWDFGALSHNAPVNFGYIPSEVQAHFAHESGQASDAENLAGLELPWDGGITQPQVIRWDDLKPKLTGDNDFRWWEFTYNGQKAENFLLPNQGNAPSCSSFSFGNAGRQTTLFRQIAEKPYQRVELVNPMPTFMKSRGGNALGGQTMERMGMEFLNTGIFLQSEVGKYDPNWRYDASLMEQHAESAKTRQIGICVIPGTGAELAENIKLAVMSGYSVAVGNSVAVWPGAVKDKNGVSTVRLGGSWAHATCFAGWKIINGKLYLLWINSHGNIYVTDDGTPPYACYMSEENLTTFVSGRWTDAILIHYVEEPYDESQPIHFDRTAVEKAAT